MASNCIRCGHPGPDVRIKSCPNGCSYHARCLDLPSLQNHHHHHQHHRAGGGAIVSPSSSSLVHRPGSDLAELTTCPRCLSPASGFEIVPLSFVEIDYAQRMAASGGGGVGGGGGGGKGGDGQGAGGGVVAGAGGKRLHNEVTGGEDCNGDGGDGRQYWSYDPANPRTGKWTDEEIAFRDSLVPHFVEGSLPLPMGLKLIEFLSSMLKSKPSRLTKKMKHAKLSTQHFQLKSGCIREFDRAREVGALENAFVNSIADPIERSEVRFHMQREWRDHIAERFTTLRISFDAEEWLRTVDIMDRRLALSKSRNRMVKRRTMMGKAMEKDTSSPPPGVFIDSNVDSHAHDDADFELLASALEANDHEDEDLNALWSNIAAANAEEGSSSFAAGGGECGESAEGTTNASTNDHRDSIDEGSERSPSSHQSHPPPVPQWPATSGGPPPPPPVPPFRSALLPNLGSAEGPNFKFAAPFLAKICGYIESSRVPFEHVDIWVPSSSDGHLNLDPSGSTAPEPTVLGSGSKIEGSRGRLVFAGSASVGVQVVSESEIPNASASGAQSSSVLGGGYDQRCKPGSSVIPLTSDEIYHLSLFGSYSEKFSFSYGCGLPGRVFESGVPAWEQFVINAPSHLFERRGGAIQFGIKTAVGLPIRSPNVGRVVLVLYSRHNRDKDDFLVAQMVRDFQVLCPSPRWKLMVDMGHNMPPPQQKPEQVQQPRGGLAAAMAGFSEKNLQLLELVSLLGENMPSDESTPLGRQIHNIMSLRLILLRKTRNAEEEQLVDSILFLFDSYTKAGRSRADITLMLARDFAFHSIQNQQAQRNQNDQQQFQRPLSVPSMQHLTLGSSLPQQSPPAQVPPMIQFDHSYHGQQNTSQVSFSNMASCSDSDFQQLSSRRISGESPLNGYLPSFAMNGGNVTMTEQNYSTLGFNMARSPTSESFMGSSNDHSSYNDPPMHLANC